MKIHRRRRKKARIEMIPLIDTFFLVLVFFIYGMLSMVVHRGVPVRLPKASTAVLDQKEYLAVTLTSDGKILFNEEECSLEVLRARLHHQAAAIREKPLYINGDKTVAHGLVVEVLDAVRDAGFEKVMIEAKEKGS